LAATRDFRGVLSPIYESHLLLHALRTTAPTECARCRKNATDKARDTLRRVDTNDNDSARVANSVARQWLSSPGGPRPGAAARAKVVCISRSFRIGPSLRMLCFDFIRRFRNNIQLPLRSSKAPVGGPAQGAPPSPRVPSVVACGLFTACQFSSTYPIQRTRGHAWYGSERK
jgi:hypothetical protein